jgi:bisphosphoglycerate-independent phosphoglycerate mutase (AlkP superfamily)
LKPLAIEGKPKDKEVKIVVNLSKVDKSGSSKDFQAELKALKPVAKEVILLNPLVKPFDKASTAYPPFFNSLSSCCKRFS